jgi:hypothetical protein
MELPKSEDVMNDRMVSSVLKVQPTVRYEGAAQEVMKE